MSTSTFIYGEVELAATIGLPVHILQKTRAKKMAAESDWALNGNRVAYSRVGVGGLVRLLAVELENNPIGLEELLQKSRLRVNGELPEFEGTLKRFWPNPHLVDFTLPDKSIARVRVQTTKNLREGMVLKLVQSPEGDWVLAQRLPRSVREGRRHARGA